jgi:hypothetical protein
VFCPNCGAENKETTSPCVRCGFKLSGVNASKFKGTIMLNSDETVQELIEAQRRKMAEASAADPAATPSGSSAQLPAAGQDAAGAGGVPRPRRKLGGATILGVAPQLGGFKGGSPSGALESPQPGGEPERPALNPGAEVRRPSRPPTDPHAPTEAMQAFSPGADLSTTAVGGTAPQAAFVEPTPAPAPAGGTQPLQQVSAPTAAPVRTQASAPGAGESVPPNATVPLQQVPDQRSPDPANTTAPLPAQTRAAVEAARVSSLPPIKKGLSAGEVFLVIATCGLYGVVRMLRQRKQP